MITGFVLGVLVGSYTIWHPWLVNKLNVINQFLNKK